MGCIYRFTDDDLAVVEAQEEWLCPKCRPRGGDGDHPLLLAYTEGGIGTGSSDSEQADGGGGGGRARQRRQRPAPRGSAAAPAHCDSGGAAQEIRGRLRQAPTSVALAAARPGRFAIKLSSGSEASSEDESTGDEKERQQGQQVAHRRGRGARAGPAQDSASAEVVNGSREPAAKLGRRQQQETTAAVSQEPAPVVPAAGAADGDGSQRFRASGRRRLLHNAAIESPGAEGSIPLRRPPVNAAAISDRFVGQVDRDAAMANGWRAPAMFGRRGVQQQQQR